MSKNIKVRLRNSRGKTGRVGFLSFGGSDRRERPDHKNFALTMDVLERINDGFVVFDPQMNYTYVNRRGGELLGRAPEDLIGKNYWREYPEAASTPFAKAYIRAMVSQAPIKLEDYYEPWGRWFENRIYPSRNDLSVFFSDITERKQNEINVHNLSRLYVTRSKINQAIVRIKNRQELFEAVCRVAVEYGQFRMAWIGLADADSGAVEIVAFSGKAEKYIRQVEINFKDRKSRNGPTATAIRKKTVVLVNDVKTDPRMEPWRKGVLENGYRSLAAVPLCIGENVIGVLDLYATQADFFDEDELCLLKGIGKDISFALDAMAVEEERRRVQVKIETQLERLSALQAIDTAITSGLDLQYIFKNFVLLTIEQSGVDAVNVLTFHPELNELRLLAERGFLGDQSSRARQQLGYNLVGRAIRERKQVHIRDLSGAELTQAEIALVTIEGFVSYLAVPLITKGEVKGALELFHRSKLSPEPEWLKFIQTLADRSAISIADTELLNKLKQSNIELLSAYDETIEGWSRALDLRDKETEGHTQRVTRMALQLATIMGASETELVHLRRGALLHDMGKMGVPDHILFKTTALNAEELKVMREHPRLAFEMLAPISFLRPALDIPYCHHEKWDGTGYPRGLKGEEIPLAARIFAAVDVYDALTSDRPYRKRWPAELALGYIREHAGSHFDPQVVSAFLSMA